MVKTETKCGRFMLYITLRPSIATSHYGDDTALPLNIDLNVPYYPSLGYFSLWGLYSGAGALGRPQTRRRCLGAPCYNHAPMAGRSRASLVPRAPYERTRTPTIDNPQPWLQCHFSRSCESPPGASVFTRCDKISPAQHPQYRCYYRKLYKLP